VPLRDLERRLALAELLDQPDPPELRRRGHRRRLDGRSERFRLLPLLSAVFVQNDCLNWIAVVRRTQSPGTLIWGKRIQCAERRSNLRRNSVAV
jgi:hypothetical protein